MRKDLKSLYLIFSFCLWLCYSLCGYSQQVTLGTPNLNYTKACASTTFNYFAFSFQVSNAALLGANNQFIVELSNASGAFTAPVTVNTFPTPPNTILTVNGNFTVPTNVYGQGYKIRVRSTNPAKTSPASVVFPAYYAAQDGPYSINNSNNIVNLCSGNSYTLTIDSGASSPLNNPALTYTWLRNEIEIPGQTGSSLSVSQPGNYYVRTYYGGCSTDYTSYSNTVSVYVQTILTPQITTNDGNNNLCPGASKTLTSDTQQPGFTYIWYRNNTVIQGATSPSYTATQSGLYHLRILGGGCVFETNDIELEDIDFNLDPDPAVPTLIIPGQIIQLTAINDATNPTYQWLKDGTAISGAAQATYNATQAGVYKAVVNEASPCNITKEVTITLLYPDSFNLAIQAASGYQSCVSTSSTLSISQFDAVKGAAVTSILGNNYGYGYQWYKNNMAVSGATSTSFAINSAADNGSYVLKVTIPNFGEITSNAVAVNLSPGTVTISGPTSICEGAIAALTSSVTNAAYTYQWYKDGTMIPAISTPTLAADQPGNYYLRVTLGSCTVQSNTINISIETVTVSSTSPSTDVIIPGQTKTLTVTTTAQGPQYVWYRNNVALPQTGPSLSATLDGVYKVVVTQTVGCNATAETTFTLNYPTGFTLAIAANAGYTSSCTSTTATLSITSFEAQTSNGNVNVANMGYAYQWYRNNVAIAGATSATLTLNSSSQNGVYKLVSTVPDFPPVTSNNVTVNLAMEAITISGSTSLCTGSTVVLTANVNNAAYTYQWFRNGTAIAGETTASLTVNTAGDYYVRVTGAACTAQSNTLQIQVAAVNISVNVPASDIIFPGQTKNITVTTNAASPAYAWYRNNVLLSTTTATLAATQSGTYKVIVTQTAGCNATAETTFVLNYPSAFNLAIAADSAYSSCSSTIATVSKITFTATVPTGTVDASNMGYTYQWFRNNVAVPGATSASFIINSAAQNGTYRLEAAVPDFGTIVSNNVTINLAVESIVITNTAAFCEGSSVVLTANVSNAGYTYQWYKNTTALTGETSPTLTANTEGDYYLIVSGGTCTMQSNTIHLQAASISVNTTNPALDIILPGQNKILSVTTDAVAPSYAWYRNNMLLSATTPTYTATQDGVYKVVITQTSGCAASEEVTFTLQYPSSFIITVAANAAYTSCVSSTATLTVTSFMAVTPSGNVDASALNYPIQWYKGVTAVPGAAGNTLTLNNPSQNGVYKVTATIPDFAPVNSNTVTVNLTLPVGAVVISSNGPLCDNATVVLSSSITDAAYTYQWYKDGVQLAGANTSSFTTGNSGAYYLIVTAGTCTSQSNTVNLQNAIITVNSNNPVTDVILPGQTKVISVTTDAVSPTYQWYRNNLPLTDTTASITATQDGTYKVVVTQTAGCTIAEERTFNLVYPTSFSLAVAANSGYSPCGVTPVTLSISSFTAVTQSGSVDVSSLGYSYQWYKNSVPLTGATSATLLLNDAAQSGSYTLIATIPDFGIVTSNAVVVNIAIPSGGVTATQNGDLCDGSTVVLSSNVTDTSFTYQWYKNASPLANATASTFTADSAGAYYVVVTAGTCTTQSNILNVAVAAITVSSTNAAADFILPGGTKVLAVTTSAVAPAYQWYRNGVLLSETSASLTATQDGTYKVVVTQTSGCPATQEKIFTLTYPTGFQISAAAGPSYTACTSTSVTLSVSSFVALTQNGNINVLTAGYQYQWYKDNVAVPGATGATLVLNSQSQNGAYRVEATIPGFPNAVSNNVVVNLGIGTVIITSAGALCDSSSQVVFSSSVTDALFTYAWYKDGVVVSSGNSPQYTASEPGSYNVKVTSGSCTTTSNTLTIQMSDFSLTATSPLSDIIIPGDTTQLGVYTTALQPTYAWYRNGVLIPGATSATLIATLAGEYKVVVTQTQDCVMSKEIVFDLANPSGFALTIGAQDYTSCVSTQTNLFITEFKAVTNDGIVNLIGNNFGYGYQWYMDGAIIPGATNVTYVATQTGIYSLEVNIPGFGIVTSNGLAIEIAFAASVTIQKDGVFCADGTEVTLFSDAVNPGYQYTWFRNGAAIAGATQPTVVVSQSGSYYLSVVYNGCTIASNTVTLEPYDMDQVTISVGTAVDLPEGTSIIVTASGAESYTWYKDGKEISIDDNIKVTEPGVYTMVGKAGDCEVTREFIVTIVENKVLAIPNIITPNNDGVNDTWALPLKYLNDDTEVVIYSPTGAIVFRASHYNNNWPESDFTWSRKDPVYYYTIMEKNVITKRGSITIVK